MAGHSGTGSSASQQGSLNQLQTNVIKTMILVSAFFAVAWLPSNIVYLISHLVFDLALSHTANYVGTFLGFFYISANPFIYAFKFNPVRCVLVGLIPWKKPAQSSEGVEMHG